jgi:hypothetical protein
MNAHDEFWILRKLAFLFVRVGAVACINSLPCIRQRESGLATCWTVIEPKPIYVPKP